MPIENDILKARPFRAFLADMEALGVTPVAQGGRPYAVVSARSNARWWLLPLDNRRAAAAGLEMLQPVSTVAKFGKIVARFLALYGPQGLLGQKRILMSGMPDLAGSFGEEDVSLAYFTGTDGPHRKTTLQVMDDRGAVLGYAKMSREPHIRSYIRHEAAMLERVSNLDLPSADVPQLLALRDDPEFTMLVTNSHKTKDVTIPLRLGTEHDRWLNDLRAKTLQVGATALLDTLENRLKLVESAAGSRWHHLITSGLSALRPIAAEIPLCLTHGDFTPWNCFVQKGHELYVFDWEYANPAWPVGFDFVHFLLATIPDDRKLMNLPHLLEDLARHQFDNNQTAARRALLLSFICHALFYLERIVEAQGDLTDWPDNLVRARMIDWLLQAEKDAAC